MAQLAPLALEKRTRRILDVHVLKEAASVEQQLEGQLQRALSEGGLDGELRARWCSRRYENAEIGDRGSEQGSRSYGGCWRVRL